MSISALKSDLGIFARFLKFQQWRVQDSEALGSIYSPHPRRLAWLCLLLSWSLSLCLSPSVSVSSSLSVSVSVCLCPAPLPLTVSPLSLSLCGFSSLSSSVSVSLFYLPLLSSSLSSPSSLLFLSPLYFSLCLSLSFVSLSLFLYPSLSSLSSPSPSLRGQQASSCCRLLFCLSSCHLLHRGAPSKCDKVGLSCGPARSREGDREAGAGRGSSQQPSRGVTCQSP